MVVGGWWLVVGGWWLMSSGCLLVVGGWWLVVGGWWLVVCGWWLVVGCWWLDVGGWLLVVGGWWLVFDCWWLVVGGQHGWVTGVTGAGVSTRVKTGLKHTFCCVKHSFLLGRAGLKQLWIVLEKFWGKGQHDFN